MPRRRPPTAVRRSAIHGRGVFATRRIRPGARILEYTGERIDDDELVFRYGEDPELGHTMLFGVDGETTIDATRRGGMARYINHSCAGNCRSILDGGRVFIEAIRNIQPGAELTYDYQLQRAGRHTAALLAAYACHCGARRCRGTLLYRRRRRSR
jgi:SET domain-containing protein